MTDNLSAQSKLYVSADVRANCRHGNPFCPGASISLFNDFKPFIITSPETKTTLVEFAFTPDRFSAIIAAPRTRRPK